MNSRDLMESIRIPVLFVVEMWLIIAAMMIGIEAIWYIDDHILSLGHM